MKDLANDPDYWRGRAKETRALAETISEPISKQTMLELAEGYERLAARAEASFPRRQASRPHQPQSHQPESRQPESHRADPTED